MVVHVPHPHTGYKQIRKATEVHSVVNELSIDIASPGMRISVQTLGLLSNKTLDVQDYLRDREVNTDKENFLGWLLDLLKHLPFVSGYPGETI